MTIRQKLLQAVYPLFMRWARFRNKGKGIRWNEKNAEPPSSFYNLHGVLSSGGVYPFSLLAGKKVLVTNTASFCGYTNQYSELQKLQDIFGNDLVVLAFPSNDFKHQEPEDDSRIMAFCSTFFHLSFPIFKKNAVLRPSQNEVFKWLSDPALNGWNSRQPTWNFCKYLIDGKGKLQAFFQPYISPMDPQIVDAIRK